MNSVIERALKHYEDLGRQQIDVPEWGVTIYWTPLTLEEANKLARGAEARGKPGTAADLIIMKAVDEKGEKLFTIEHKQKLEQKVDRNVLLRISNAMMGDASVEGAEKN